MDLVQSTYCVISLHIDILLKSTFTPGGESFCMAINSFWSRFYVGFCRASGKALEMQSHIASVGHLIGV